jgi:hypothetical protein
MSSVLLRDDTQIGTQDLTAVSVLLDVTNEDRAWPAVRAWLYDVKPDVHRPRGRGIGDLHP